MNRVRGSEVRVEARGERTQQAEPRAGAQGCGAHILRRDATGKMEDRPLPRQPVP